MQEKVIEKNRIFALDTIKAILIFLVVFGHLLEINLNGIFKYIYCVIYVFHMPAFIICSGYLFKFDRKKLIKKIIIPYFIVQTIATIFYCVYVKKTQLVFNYTKPCWTLWYLLALGFWAIFVMLFDTKDIKKQILVLVVSFIAGIVVGFDDSVGNYLSLSRVIVFLPFFMLGYYAKNWFNIWEIKEKIKKSKKIIIGVIIFILLISILIYIYI